MEEQPKKPGRPSGSFKWGEEQTKRLELRLTPTARKWVDKQPKAFITDWIEEQARK